MEANQDRVTGGTCHDMVLVNIPETRTRNMWLDSLKEEPVRTKSRIMHKVPGLLANGNSKHYYRPKIVSLGPFHRGKRQLKPFQERKPSMVNRFIPDEEFQRKLRREISSNIKFFIAVYPKETREKMDTDSEWEEMLFLDGCFVLYFILCIMYHRIDDLKMKRYEIDSVQKDLFLLENQLPYQLLKIVSGNDPELLDLVCAYIRIHKMSRYTSWKEVLCPKDEPVHLLDCLHTIITSGHSEPNNKLRLAGTRDTTSKGSVLCHAKELITKGIHLKPNRSGFPMDIFFKSNFFYGTLRLQKIIVDDSTRPLFSNLAAYEMCSGVGSAITSYICFLDSLVNHAEDITELQSAGILINHLPTNEDAAKIFNEMSEGLHPDADAYSDVKRKMQKFFQHKAKANLASWIAEGYHKHFKSPLTAVAVLAALLALCLAATQTYFTVFPRGNSSNKHN